MKQNSSHLIRLLARLEDVLTDGQFVLDGLSVSKVISGRNVDRFLTKFPHESDWFLYFGNVSWDKLINVEINYLSTKFVFGFILNYTSDG